MLRILSIWNGRHVREGGQQIVAHVLQVLNEVSNNRPRTRKVRVQQGYFCEARSGEHDLLIAGIPLLKLLETRTTRIDQK